MNGTQARPPPSNSNRKRKRSKSTLDIWSEVSGALIFSHIQSYITLREMWLVEGYIRGTGSVNMMISSWASYVNKTVKAKTSSDTWPSVGKSLMVKTSWKSIGNHKSWWEEISTWSLLSAIHSRQCLRTPDISPCANLDPSWSHVIIVYRNKRTLSRHLCLKYNVAWG